MTTRNKTVIQYILIKTEKNQKKKKHAPNISIFWMDKKIIKHRLALRFLHDSMQNQYSIVK